MRRLLLWIGQERHTFGLLLLLLVIDRVLLLTTFNFKMVGSDETIFWQGATDYLHGRFHEPYYYGQNYNFMLEALVAVPLLLLQIPHAYALPLSTTFLALFPFVYFSRILFKNGYRTEGMAFLILPILLPVEYGILTSISRGFISGLFFCSFLAPALMHPTKRSALVLAAVATSLGYLFNPNSLVFSLPVMVYLLLHNYRAIWFYATNLLVAVPVLLLEYWAKSFYVNHPDYNVHRAWTLEYDIGRVFENFGRLDQFFGYFTPIVWQVGWLVLVFILVVGVLQMKRDWRKGVSLVFGILFIVFTLGINKVNDHIDSIFLSSSRMFLGIPLLAGLAVLWSRDLLNVSDKHLKWGLVVMALAVLPVKSSLSGMITDYHAKKAIQGKAMPLKYLRHLKTDCAELTELAQREHVGLILFVSNWEFVAPEVEFLNYGCPLLEEDFPRSLMNVFERRSWVYLAEKSKVEPNVLIYNFALDSSRVGNFPNAVTLEGHPAMTLVHGNDLPLDTLLARMSVRLYRSPY